MSKSSNSCLRHVEIYVPDSAKATYHKRRAEVTSRMSPPGGSGESVEIADNVPANRTVCNSALLKSASIATSG